MFSAVSRHSATLDSVGIPFSTYSGTVATSVYRSGIHHTKYTTGTGSGANAGLFNTNFSDAQFVWADDFDVSWAMRTDPSAITDTRYSFGLSTTDPTSDTYTNAILIRRSSVADGATWVGVTTAAGSQSVTASLGAIAANTAYVLRIRKVGSTVYFSINNGTEVSTSSNIPSASQPYLISLAQNIAGSGGTRSWEFRQLSWIYGG